MDYFIRTDITEKELIKILDSKNYFLGNDSNWGFELDDSGKPIPYLYKNRDKISRRFAKFANIIEKLNMRNVLEIGCGLGFLLHELKERDINCIGIDIAEWAVRHALYPPWDLNMMVASATSLPFKDKSFDLIFSIDVFEHVLASKVPTLISECARVGKFNLHLISTEPSGLDRDKTHVTLMPMEWWRKQAPSPDFLIVEAYGSWAIEVKGKLIHLQIGEGFKEMQDIRKNINVGLING